MTGPDSISASRKEVQTPPRPVALSAEEAVKLAVQLQRSNLLAEAEMLLARTLACVPADPGALHYLGVLRHQQGRGEEAVELIRRAITLQPEDPSPYNNLGNVLEQLGRFPAAEAAYRKVIALQPDFASAHNNLGIALKAQEKPEEALDSFRTAVALQPGCADHQFNLACALKWTGNLDEALEVFRKALSIEPGHEAAQQSLAAALLQANRLGEAIQACRDWLRVDPGNPRAQHMLAAYTGKDVPEKASEHYVQRVFDQMAEIFDDHLQGLGYRAPELVAAAFSEELPDGAADLDILDAGCGTGLCGPLLRPYARQLVGVDLSAGMLAKAEVRGVYDRLAQAELTEFLRAQEASWDAIVSADTLVYFGSLASVLQAAATALRPGGSFVFTLEDAGEEAPAAGFRLNPHGRFSHAKHYVDSALREAGFAPCRLSSAVLRSESGQPVKGLVVAARKGS